MRTALTRRITGRPGRVILLVIFLAMLNAFDLVFTILAHRIGEFREANPIAALLLDHTAALVAFKAAALLVASAIFIVFRRHWLTELVCWTFCGVYTALSILWMVYYANPPVR
jgi:hypothetical protein